MKQEKLVVKVCPHGHDVPGGEKMYYCPTCRSKLKKVKPEPNNRGQGHQRPRMIGARH